MREPHTTLSGSTAIQWTLTYRATMGPDHGQISETARYVNHHANRVYVSLLALPFSFRVMLPIVDANNRRILTTSGLGQSKFWHLRVFQ